MATRSKKPQRADKNLLSVIVPAYKCSTIYRDLKGIEKHLKQLPKPYEIICVVDGVNGSKDKTLINAKRAKSQTIKIYSYPINKGKGYAIRYGMARAKGCTVAFIDAGSDLNASGIALALEHLKWYDADIIVGSKRHKASKIAYPFNRKILSFIVQHVTRFIFGFNVSDTQTGLKIFKREVLEDVLPRLVVKRFAFDLEILTVAHKLGYKRIFESPVEINYNFASTINSGDIYFYAIDYLAIIYRTYLLRYYANENQDIWEDDKKLKLKYKA